MDDLEAHLWLWDAGLVRPVDVALAGGPFHFKPLIIGELGDVLATRSAEAYAADALPPAVVEYKVVRRWGLGERSAGVQLTSALCNWASSAARLPI